MEYTIHLGEDTLKQLDEIVNGGSESGGGGSSDFSTAEVTLIYTSSAVGGQVGTPSLPIIYIYGGAMYQNCSFGTPSEPIIIDAVLYRGVQDYISLINLNLTEAPTISGSCEIVTHDEMPYLKITGDCSISINLAR